MPENKAKNYLLARGIQEKTYASYLGSTLRLGQKAVFALYQQMDKKGKGRMCSTITYQFGLNKEGHPISKKYFQKGLSRGVVVLKEGDEQIKKIIITESPIDALSHKQLHRIGAGTMYIATCGTLSENIKREVSGLLAHAYSNQQEVILAFDQDLAGKKLSKQVEELAKHQQVCVGHALGLKEKDWNCALNHGLNAQEMAHVKKQQRILAQSGQEYQLMRKNKHKATVMGMEIRIN